MKKKIFALLFALMLFGAAASAEITVTKRDLNMNADLDKSTTNILILMQNGERTDTMMVASINSKTGRSVMTRIDCGLMVDVPEAGTVELGDVYHLGAKKSKGFLAARTINTLLGLNIGTYVALDITRLPELVEVVGALNMQLTAEEAEAMGTWEGINELTGDAVLEYVTLRLDSDSPARSREYDALMQLLYQGMHSGDLMSMMGLGKKLLASMDTNLNPMTAVTLVSAVQGGDDRRELILPQEGAEDAESMKALIHREIYE